MNPDTHFPRIIITSGEPAGIGPDIVIQAAEQDYTAEIVVIADTNFIRKRAQQIHSNLEFTTYDSNRSGQKHIAGNLTILNVQQPVACAAGKPDKKNAPYVLKTLELATRACLEKQFDAMVTAPVHKGIINDAGYSFTGHTEYLADICTAGYPVMMLADKSLRVALATTHLPLSQVSQAINPDKLEKVIRIIHSDLQSRFNVTNAKILVCGLNPHAGEGGHLGHEENTIIIPVLEKLRREGMNISGPVPADTAFTRNNLDNTDVVLAMYHDQGLPVLKARGFGEIVNITLGLPVIRTSVDHGTAFELAGTGKATASSLVSAIHAAIELTQKVRKKNDE